MKHILPAALALCLLLPFCPALTGCAASPSPAYDPAAFTCTLSIDSVSTGEEGYFQASFASTSGTARLTVTAPAHLAGLTFTLPVSDTGAACTMEAAGTVIPLSREVSASLAALAALLCADPEDAADREKSGNGVVLVYDTGTLTLDKNGIPVCAETADGRRASVLQFPAGET